MLHAWPHSRTNAGPGAAGRRSAVEFFEVAIHTLDEDIM